jgi:hypothetical protein
LVFRFGGEFPRVFFGDGNFICTVKAFFGEDLIFDVEDDFPFSIETSEGFFS